VRGKLVRQKKAWKRGSPRCGDGASVGRLRHEVEGAEEGCAWFGWSRKGGAGEKIDDGDKRHPFLMEVQWGESRGSDLAWLRHAEEQGGEGGWPANDQGWRPLVGTTRVWRPHAGGTAAACLAIEAGKVVH
jgi:hypothetical protein